MDPGGHLPGGRHALGIRLWAPLAAALGSVLLAEAAGIAVARAARRAARRGAAQRHAAVRDRRRDHDARHAAAVLLDGRALGAGAAATRAGTGPGSWPPACSPVSPSSASIRLCCWSAASSSGSSRARRCGSGCAALGLGRAGCWRWRFSRRCCCGTPRMAGRASPSRAAVPARGIRRRALQFVARAAGRPDRARDTPCVRARASRGALMAARLAWRGRAPVRTLLGALTVPPALIFLQHALGDRVQGNWPAVVYPAAALAGAGLTGRFWVRLRVPAVALGGVITLLVYLQATLAPVPAVPAHGPDPASTRGMARTGPVGRFGDRAGGGGLRRGGRLRYRRRTCPRSPRRAVGHRRRASLEAVRSPAGRAGGPRRSARAEPPARRRSRPDTSGPRPRRSAALRRARDGIVAEEFRVYRVTGREGGGPAVVLPRPG